jgi:hypothetical protein
VVNEEYVDTPYGKAKVLSSYANCRTYGLTNEELAEAMMMYTEAKASEAMNEIIDEFDQKHSYEMGDVLRPIVEFFMKKAFDNGFTEGMTLGGNTYSLVEFYKEAKSRKATSLVQTYEFEPSKGVSGILFPDGTFQKCGNAEHQFLVVDIPMDVQMKCLYFSSHMRGDGDGVISHSPVGFSADDITDVQREWLRDNFPYFDRGQKRRAEFDYGVRL